MNTKSTKRDCENCDLLRYIMISALIANPEIFLPKGCSSKVDQPLDAFTL